MTYQQILILLGVLVASLAALSMLWARLFGDKMRTKMLERQAAELRTLTEKLERMENEQRFVSQFIREFPHLTAELQSQRKLRRVPVVLMQMMIRTFQPEQAVVLLRRKATLSEPDRDRRLVVAAVTPTDSPIMPGIEIFMGEGELGYVAESKRVMDRREFDQEFPAGESDGGGGALGLRADLAAPMVQDDRTIGVLALAGPRRSQARGKGVLRLIAQMGAFTLTNMATLVEMKSAADVDPLTGIYNKRVLNLKLSELVFDAEKAGTSVAIFLFDIDHFKNFNDVNGHVAGDQLLRLLTHVVRDQIRADDIFGRFGGEEFLLILPEREATQAARTAETIRREIESFDFPFGEWQPLGRLTVSGGIAAFPADAHTAAELLRVADAALYDAKNAGRNRVVMAGGRALEGSREPAETEPEPAETEPEPEDGSTSAAR